MKANAVRVFAKVPDHVAIALSQVGVVEIPGAKSHPAIESYHAVTAAGAAPDSVPWCSSFMCWVMEQAGFRHTRSKRAASWRDWGVSCPPTRLGALLFFGAKDPAAGGSGHVGLSLGVTGSDVFLLGGNQRDRVDIGVRKVRDIFESRWPAELTV